MFRFDLSIAEELVFTARLLYDKGLANAFEGNVSVRAGDAVYITPSAVCKGFLKPEQVAVVALDGAVLHADGVKPSSETRLHLACYAARPDVKGVVHAHPPHATAFAVAGREISAPGYPEALVLYGKIPLAAYGRPSTDGIWQGVVPLLPDYDVVLLENHGVVAVGGTALEAFFRLESAESIARVLILAETLGGEKPLPEQERAALSEMHRKQRACCP